jgi:uncharacterized membrane protein
MTAAKFKPLIFSVSGFALSNVANICIFMILDDFRSGQIRVTLRLTVSQSVCLGVVPNLGQLTRVYFLILTTVMYIPQTGLRR